jgi:hypothetical protein
MKQSIASSRLLSAIDVSAAELVVALQTTGASTPPAKTGEEWGQF